MEIDIQDKLAEASAKSRDFANNIAALQERLLAAKKARKTLNAALREVEADLLELLGAGIITIYQSIDNGKEISAVFKGGVGAQAVEKQKIKVPLAAGEHFSNRWEFREVVEGRGIDFLQPDVCHGGGITELKRIAAYADMHYLMMAPHNSGGPISTLATLHVLASIPNAYILEQMEDERQLRDSICTEPLVFDKGYFLLPKSPGLGTDLKLDALKEHAFKRHPPRHSTASLWY